MTTSCFDDGVYRTSSPPDDMENPCLIQKIEVTKGTIIRRVDGCDLPKYDDPMIGDEWICPDCGKKYVVVEKVIPRLFWWPRRALIWRRFK